MVRWGGAWALRPTRSPLASGRHGVVVSAGAVSLLPWRNFAALVGSPRAGGDAFWTGQVERFALRPFRPSRWDERSMHVVAAVSARTQASAPESSSSSSEGSSSDGDGLAGDCGVWQGSERVGDSELRAQQDASHQTQVRGLALCMASARREAARAAALAEHVAAAVPGTGHFHPPRRGIPHANGTTVQFPPRGGSTSDLTYPELRSVEAPQTSWQERTADTTANLQL